jgi:protein-tyrosine phosphatase/arsenate reductase
MYVCTHNSRRSHFGQIWATVAAEYYGIKNVVTFSGGTEATAFNVNAIKALKEIGFEIQAKDESLNPIFEVKYSDDSNPTICFSKVYDDAFNPNTNFAAIMTCSDAEENCPFIPGVELRIGTTYNDPKEFDGTYLQDSKYKERALQIALETLYVFSLIK